MAVHRHDEPTFFEDITDPSLHYSRAIAQSVGLELGTMLVGPSGQDGPAAMLLQLPPSYRLERHAHRTHRVEVLVRGSLELADGRVLGPGDVSTSAPGEFYGPVTAGPDGALSVEIFGSTQGLAPVADEADSPEARAYFDDIAAKTAAARAAGEA